MVAIILLASSLEETILYSLNRRKSMRMTVGYSKPAPSFPPKPITSNIEPKWTWYYTSKANDLGERFRRTITDLRGTKPIKANDFIFGLEAND